MFSVLLVLSVLFSSATSQLADRPSDHNISSTNHLIKLFFKDRKPTDYVVQHVDNGQTAKYAKSNLKNVPLHSIVDNDHNFELLTHQQSNKSSVLFDKQLTKRKGRSLSSKVFSQPIDRSNDSQNKNNNLNQTMPIFVNKTTALPFDRSSFLGLDNSTFLEQMNLFTLSPLPLVSFENNASNGTGPDQIYIDALRNTRFWVQRIASPFVIIVGVIGNSMTIVIMTRKRMRSSTNVYLAALATVDMMYLSLTFILSLKHYPGITSPTSVTRLYWRLLPVLMMTADACTNCSVWLTAAFTIERFIVVSNPIRGKALCTESRARKLCIIIFAFCTAFVIPTPFEWQVMEKVDKAQQTPILSMEPSELGRNSTYKSIYYWLTSVLFIFVPLIFLIVFNSFLIRSVHISRKERAHMTNTQTTSASSKKKKKEEKKLKKNQELVCKLNSDANNNNRKASTSPKSHNLELGPSHSSRLPSNSNSQNANQTNVQSTSNSLQPKQIHQTDNRSLDSRRTSASSPTTLKNTPTATPTPNRIEQQSAKQENKITIMLISVVMLFLICQLPVAINLIYTSIRNLVPDTNESLIVLALNNILNLMVAVNAAGNFVLYCLLSQKYRKTLVTLFCPCLKPKRLRKCNKQQATIYSTLTTNQYHSPTSTTGIHK